MIKKQFVYASMVGLVAGVIYWLCKKEKNNNTVFKSVDGKEDFKYQPQEEDTSRKSNVVEEMNQVKSERAQDVYERHSEAGEIMKDAYHNIMEDFVEDISSEKVANEKERTTEVISNKESVSVMKELNSISDELDDLLK